MFETHELLARECAMVPSPWLNMIRFHGVFAPNAALREQVVASARPYVPPNTQPVPNPLQLSLFGKLFEQPDKDMRDARRKLDAWL